MTLVRLAQALACLLLVGACSDARLDRTFKALEGASEAQLITGMGRPPDNVVPLQSYLDGVVPAEESATWGLDGAAAPDPIRHRSQRGTLSTPSSHHENRKGCVRFSG